MNGFFGKVVECINGIHLSNVMEGFNISDELKKLPDKAGVYIMHKKGGEVIYVGKAKNLKNRVRQYFNESYKKTNKILQMVNNIDYFEYIVVDNELESLILESNYIKEYRPKYNTLLKDDKNYPYIKVTINEDFPRVLFVHRKYEDKSKYYGPYKSVGIVYQVLDYIKKNYRIRNCKMPIHKENVLDKHFDSDKLLVIPNNKTKKKECLYYHLKMCMAPCIDKSVYVDYNNQIKDICSLLNGNYEDVIKELKVLMDKASSENDFEHAIEYRDKINSIYEIQEKQKIDQKNDDDKDVVGIYKGEKVAIVQIFEIRDGNIINRNIHFLDIDKNDLEVDILESFIKQYYNDPYFLPSEILLPLELPDCDLITKWLSRNSNKKIKLTVPKIGKNEKLVELANTNAKIQYSQRLKKYEKERDEVNIAYDVLKRITGLDNIDRIESYDISNTAGSINVASMVVFEHGNFMKNEYRKFRIKTIVGSDDYGAMNEVINRRLSRYIENNDKFKILPSIFFIDGGAGQVHIVNKVLNEYNIDIPVFGMVKDDNHRTRGLIYNDIEIDLSDYKELFKLVTRIQDETHRFAIEYHKFLRSREQTKSILDEIDTIGEKRKINLIKHFKSIDNIKNATIDEISKVPLFNLKSATIVYDFFRK